MSFFSKLKDGLNKTRNSIVSKVEDLVKHYTKFDDDLFDELEEILISADVGVATSAKIISSLKMRVKAEKNSDTHKIKTLLKEEILKILKSGVEEFTFTSPAVFLITGVNGVGKTTAIGKLAAMYKTLGKSVLVAAGDTFRAAAVDQLEIWADRAGVSIIRQKEAADSGAIIFDAINAAKSRATDLLICDTAGRLHNKKNLMSELAKLNRIIDKEFGDAHKEIFLVLDATTGQNAISQAKIYKEAVNVTGIILTKLDGTAKGGVAIAVKSELEIPIRFIGVGESIEDIQNFVPEDYVEAIFEV